MSLSHGLRSIVYRLRRGYSGIAIVLLSNAALTLPSLASAQTSSATQEDTIVVTGTVRSASGEAVAGASVFLEEKGGARLVRTQSNADGSFAFSLHKAGTYGLRAEKDGLRGASTNILTLKSGDRRHCDIVLVSATTSGSNSATSSASESALTSATIELSDDPSFTVAGVTDWSNAGLHGSDTRGRTSDALAKETLALKPADASKAASVSPNPAYDRAVAYRAKGDFAHARDEALKSLTIADTAAGHQLLGDLDERLGDPVGAVREFESATRMEPSEQSYLDWGAELLLHKAVQPAVQVFTKGSRLHPASARLLAGLGASLYAAGSYDEAALRLCAASDLSPTDPTPYLFLGKMEESTPTPAPCAEEKLARFVQQQPENALANYYYAITLWKRGRGSDVSTHSGSADALLEKAVKLEPNFAEAYVQLGIVRAATGNFASAIDAYKKAIAVNADLPDAHYQLSLAYKRTREETKAHEEFQAYLRAEKSERAEVDRQRRDLRQFVIILKDRSGSAAVPPERPQR